MCFHASTKRLMQPCWHFTREPAFFIQSFFIFPFFFLLFSILCQWFYIMLLATIRARLPMTMVCTAVVRQPDIRTIHTKINKFSGSIADDCDSDKVSFSFVDAKQCCVPNTQSDKPPPTEMVFFRTHHSTEFTSRIIPHEKKIDAMRGNSTKSHIWSWWRVSELFSFEMGTQTVSDKRQTKSELIKSEIGETEMFQCFFFRDHSIWLRHNQLPYRRSSCRSCVCCCYGFGSRLISYRIAPLCHFIIIKQKNKISSEFIWKERAHWWQIDRENVQCYY